MINDAAKQTKAQIIFFYHTLQPLVGNTTEKYSTLNNNENDNQNARFFPTDGQLRYHWGADDQIMTIINRREKSPETAESVRRRIELAKSGAMRP